MNTEHNKPVQSSATPHIEISVGPMDTFYYDNKIVSVFTYASMFWGVIGMIAGLVAAIQLAFLRCRLICRQPRLAVCGRYIPMP